MGHLKFNSDRELEWILGNQLPPKFESLNYSNSIPTTCGHQQVTQILNVDELWAPIGGYWAVLKFESPIRV